MQLLRAATELEDATDKHPVTPGALLPARELLADLLLELQQPAQALKEYEAVLQSTPNRFNSLFGAARAAELSGASQKTRAYYMRLVTLGQRADDSRAELRTARAFLKNGK